MNPWEETWVADLERWELRAEHTCDVDRCCPPRNGRQLHAVEHTRLETDGGIYVNRDPDRMHLIAAAPELYRALEAMLALYADSGPNPAAEAALRKARGE